MTDYVVRARTTYGEHREVRVEREQRPALPYRRARRRMQTLWRAWPWLHSPGCNVRLSVEPVSRWIR